VCVQHVSRLVSLCEAVLCSGRTLAQWRLALVARVYVLIIVDPEWLTLVVLCVLMVADSEAGRQEEVPSRSWHPATSHSNERKRSQERRPKVERRQNVIICCYASNSSVLSALPTVSATDWIDTSLHDFSGNTYKHLNNCIKRFIFKNVSKTMGNYKLPVTSYKMIHTNHGPMLYYNVSQIYGDFGQKLQTFLTPRVFNKIVHNEGGI